MANLASGGGPSISIRPLEVVMVDIFLTVLESRGIHVELELELELELAFLFTENILEDLSCCILITKYKNI
jgi:hypothetical protein